MFGSQTEAILAWLDDVGELARKVTRFMNLSASIALM